MFSFFEGVKVFLFFFQSAEGAKPRSGSASESCCRQNPANHRAWPIGSGPDFLVKNSHAYFLHHF